MAAKRRLLSEQEMVDIAPPEAVRVPIELIDPNPRNPRTELPEVEILAESIRTFGLLQPLTLRRVRDRYQVLGGHRRLAAFKLLQEREPTEVKWHTIPAVVKTANDEQADLMLISGQVHMRTWKPREEAAALERLAVGGRTLKQIGEALNRTESWASKRLRVYADAVLSGYVQSGKLNAGVAEVFVAVKDPALRRQLAERAAKAGWSQPQAQAELRKVSIDSQLRDVQKRALELAEILSSIDPTKLPITAARDLWVLHGRIEVLARGGKPKLPSVEQAERAAGVPQHPRKARGAQKTARRKPGYKPKY